MKLNSRMQWLLVFLLFTHLAWIEQVFAQTPTPSSTDTPSPFPTVTVTPSPVTPFPGYFQWPRDVNTGQNAKSINSSFGEFRSSHFHMGVDIPGGNELFALAAANGTVVTRRSNVQGAGNIVSILDNNGILINYYHLSHSGFTTDFPNEQTPVAVGTPIGKIGGTGTGGQQQYTPHIHFEVRSVLPVPSPDYDYRDKGYNPLSWLEPPWTPTPTTGNRPPYQNYIYAVPDNENSKIWVKTPAPYAEPLATPLNSMKIHLPPQTTPTPKVFHARGKFQFMMDTWDRINHTRGKCGVYEVGYKVEGESAWKYQIQFEEIPRDFKNDVKLIYNTGPPSESHIDPTRFIYRLFMPDGTPTPPMVVEAEPTNIGVFDTKDYPNGTPVVLRFEAKTKGLIGFPSPTPKVEEIIIIPSNADRWVNCETGDDFMNDCTDDANPCLTITHALNIASPGDVIAVAPGYCQDTDGEVFPLVMKEGVTIEGSGYCYPLNGGTVIQCTGSSPNLITCENIADPPVIDSFWIVGGYSGIFIQNASPLIKNCRISANLDTGIQCDVNSQPIILNCLIRSNGGAGISIIDTEESFVLIQNCTILQNQDGIACLPHAIATIRDCIVVDNGGYGLFINSHSEGSDLVEYSDFWNNASGDWNLSPLIGTGIIHENPQFVSGTYGSYYLDHSGPISPCIDSGSTSSIFADMNDKTTTVDGWPDWGRVDIGFHHKATLPTFTPTPTETPASTSSPMPTGATSTPTSGPSHTPLPTDTPFPTPAAMGLFDEGFESGIDGWEWEGLWHPVSDNPSSAYYNDYAEVAEGDVSFWYGKNGTGDYDTGNANSGSLTSPVIVIGDYSTLIFSSWEQTEGTVSGFDKRSVLISMDYGETWMQIWTSTDNSSDYRNVVIGLGGYSGLPIRLRFEFDTVDDQFNEYRGWFIDDISIGLGPLPSTSFLGLIILIVCMSIGLVVFRRK